PFPARIGRKSGKINAFCHAHKKGMANEIRQRPTPPLADGYNWGTRKENLRFLSAEPPPRSFCQIYLVRFANGRTRQTDEQRCAFLTGICSISSQTVCGLPKRRKKTVDGSG